MFKIPDQDKKWLVARFEDSSLYKPISHGSNTICMPFRHRSDVTVPWPHNDVSICMLKTMVYELIMDVP